MMRSRIQFDPDMSIMCRCRDVDVLVLDGLREDDVAAHWLKLHDLEELVASRASRCKVTVMTTRLEPKTLQAKMPGLLDATRGRLLSLRVEGPDKRLEHAKRMRELLLNGKEAKRGDNGS